MNNILIIGVGPHAQKTYIPLLKEEKQKNVINNIVGIDIEEKRENIENYKHASETEFLRMYFLGKQQVRHDLLPNSVVSLLDSLVKENNINGVIISTEPLFHKIYAKWALSRGISILMDKPVTTQLNLSTSLQAAQSLIADYEELHKLYESVRKANPNVTFSIVSQRRYHSAFLKVKELLAEVVWATNCPVTSVQSFHCDGQWRLPAEVIDINYHSFNQGYGKCAHSGFHFFDMAPWLIEVGEMENKYIDNIDVFSNFSRPIDFSAQLTSSDYEKIFPDYNTTRKYSPETFEEVTQHYGEIDAFVSIAFKSGKNVLTLGSINLLHNGFSQRGWLHPYMGDLYEQNGRVRLESHIIMQGPFQAILCQSYQSAEHNATDKKHYEIGGEYHFDIHVFRNSALFSHWKSYDKYAIENLDIVPTNEYFRGHQENAKRRCLLEFLQHLSGKLDRHEFVSDLTHYKRACTLMGGTYMSAAKRLQGENPLVNLEF